MSDFPREQLEQIVARDSGYRGDVCRQAITAYDQLCERFLTERTEQSVVIGKLRQNLRSLGAVP